MSATPFCPILNRHCLGSACVRWVPEVTDGLGGHHVGLRVEGSSPTPPYRPEGRDSIRYGKYTGRGVCADNLRASPFKDPNPATEK